MQLQNILHVMFFFKFQVIRGYTAREIHKDFVMDSPSYDHSLKQVFSLDRLWILLGVQTCFLVAAWLSDFTTPVSDDWCRLCFHLGPPFNFSSDPELRGEEQGQAPVCTGRKYNGPYQQLGNWECSHQRHRLWHDCSGSRWGQQQTHHSCALLLLQTVCVFVLHEFE